MGGPIPYVVDLLHPPSAPDPELRENFQRIVAQRVRPATLGLALAFGVLGLSDLVPGGDHPGSPAGLTESATAAVLFVAYLALGRKPVPAAWAEPLAAGLVVLSSASLLYHLAFGDPGDTAYLALLALGAGALLLSLRWLAVAVGTIGAGWIGVGVAVGEPGWVRQGVALAVAILLSVLTQRMRMTTLVGAERERRRFAELIEHAQDVVAVLDGKPGSGTLAPRSNGSSAGRPRG